MQTTLAKPLDSEKQADTPLGKHASPHQPYQILYWADYVNVVLCDDVPHKWFVILIFLFYRNFFIADLGLILKGSKEVNF